MVSLFDNILSHKFIKIISWSKMYKTRFQVFIFNWRFVIFFITVEHERSKAAWNWLLHFFLFKDPINNSYFNYAKLVFFRSNAFIPTISFQVFLMLFSFDQKDIHFAIFNVKLYLKIFHAMIRDSAMKINHWIIFCQTLYIVQ